MNGIQADKSIHQAGVYWAKIDLVFKLFTGDEIVVELGMADRKGQNQQYESKGPHTFSQVHSKYIHFITFLLGMVAMKSFRYEGSK